LFQDQRRPSDRHRNATDDDNMFSNQHRKPCQRKRKSASCFSNVIAADVWKNIADGTGINNDSVEAIAELIPPTPTFDVHLDHAIRFRKELDDLCTNNQVCAVCSMYHPIVHMYRPPSPTTPDVVDIPPVDKPCEDEDVNVVGDDLEDEAASSDSGSASIDSFIKDVPSSSDSESDNPISSHNSSFCSHLAKEYAASFDEVPFVDPGLPASHHVDLLKKILIPLSAIPNLDLLLADIPGTLEQPRHALTTYDRMVHVPPDAMIPMKYCLQPFSIKPGDNGDDEPTATICNDCYYHLEHGRVPPDSLVCYDTGK